MSRLIVLQHIEREGPGLFSKVALEHKKEVIICRLFLGETIPKLVDKDLLLVMGGPMGIADINNPNYPWLLEEIDLIKFALENQFKVVGVCLGAQLLAYAAGGSVQPMMELCPDINKLEVGWAPIYFNNLHHPLNLFNDSRLDVLHWHSDRIILPTGAQLIASSDVCNEQLFSIDRYAYGLQFHVEIEEEMLYQWINLC